MLKSRTRIAARYAHRGFTLIEMMVAMVLGLIVISAVLAFIFSLIRANSETVLSTRLNQELRATMAVIASDVRRARGMKDPISSVGQGGVAPNPYALVDVSSAGCVRYSYADDLTGQTTDFRAIRLENGKVVLVRGANSAAAACNSAGAVLSSDAIEVTSLTFSNPGANARRIDIELTGRLRNPPAYMGANPSMSVTTKSIRQTVSIRSNGA